VWPPLTSSAIVGSSISLSSSREGRVEGDRERLGRGDADHEGAGEPGAAGHRYRVEVGQLDARLRERLLQRRADGLDVRPRGDLRHDAPVAGMLIHGCRDHVGEQRRATHDSDPGLVAARLDAEHQGCLAVHAGSIVGVGTVNLITIASTLSGW
jgi:hypothetical protein